MVNYYCIVVNLLSYLSIRLYPIAVISMIATTVIEVQDPMSMLQQMLAYVITVIVALLFHSLVILPLIFFIFVRKNPYKHVKTCGKAILTAFVTGNRYIFVILEKGGHVIQTY